MYRLASHLRQKGYSAKCVWSWNEVPDDMWHMIMKHHVDIDTVIVAISATVMFRDQADGQRNFFGVTNQQFRHRCEAIKKRAPNCKIVVGGGQIQFCDPAWLKLFDCVDYFASGQGEEIIAYLLHCAVSKTRPRLSDITKPYVVHDSSIPYKDFSTSITLWQKEDAVRYQEPLPLELARGCIFSCSFCSYDLTGKKPQDYVRQKNLTEQEILHNYQHFGTDTYYITDDLINESDYKIDMIYEIAQNLPFELKLSGYIRLDLVRRWPNAFKKLVQSGLYCAFFGVETLNDNSGRAVGKGLGRVRIMQAIEIIADLCGDQFIGNAGMILGLPHDTPETCHEILEWSIDPVVRTVIKSVWLQTLSISTRHGSSKIDKDPGSFGYTITPEITGSTQRLNTDTWRTATYNSQMAMQHAIWFDQKFKSMFPWSAVASPWTLPWVTWLDHDNKKSLRQNVVKGHDHDAFQSWFSKITQKHDQSHRDYLQLLHQSH